MSDPFLSEDDLIVLSLAADGERMIAIGRWEKPTEKLEALGYLEYAPDKFNAVITAAGRERWTAEEAAERAPGWRRSQAAVVVVDATVGLGGHSFAAAQHLGRSGRLIGFDKDSRALELASLRLAPPAERADDWPAVELVHASFAEIGQKVAAASAEGGSSRSAAPLP